MITPGVSSLIKRLIEGKGSSTLPILIIGSTGTGCFLMEAVSSLNLVELGGHVLFLLS